MVKVIRVSKLTGQVGGRRGDQTVVTATQMLASVQLLDNFRVVRRPSYQICVKKS